MTEDQARLLFLEHCQPGNRGALERHGERPAVAAILAALRPQPSGETREAVARIVADHISGGFDAALQDKQEWKDRSGLGYDCEPVDVNGPFKDDYLSAADAILTLLSARPLALVGQHSSGEEIDEDTPWPESPLATDLFNHVQSQYGLDNDEASEEAGDIIAILVKHGVDPTKLPARAEAQDEGAAGSFEERAIMLTKKHGNPVGTDYEQGQNDMGYRMVTMARDADAALAAARAHPSPTPAADADRVRIAVELINAEINAPLTGPTHGAWDRGRIAGLKEALAALKSEGK